MGNTGNERTMYYGKGDVFVYRTYSNPLTGVTEIPESTFTGKKNIIFGMNIQVAIGGEQLLTSFTEGDNTLVVATDSMKNFIQRHAAKYTGATLEGFLQFVTEQFLQTYSHINVVKLTGKEVPFEQVHVLVDSKLIPSDLVFRHSRNECTTATIELVRTKTGSKVITQQSGIADLQLIKVKGNSFAGFVQDEYTTLPETYNRPLFIYLNINWTYKDKADAKGTNPTRYVSAEQVRDIANTVFHHLETRSIQHLIYEIGCQVLRRFPQLTEVQFESQNRTWETVVEEAENGIGKVYTEPRPPYGFQVFTVKTEDIEKNEGEVYDRKINHTRS